MRALSDSARTHKCAHTQTDTYTRAPAHAWVHKNTETHRKLDGVLCAREFILQRGHEVLVRLLLCLLGLHQLLVPLLELLDLVL